VKKSTRDKVAAVFYAIENLRLMSSLCACRRPVSSQLPHNIQNLIDEARAALAEEHEDRMDYMDFD